MALGTFTSSAFATADDNNSQGEKSWRTAQQLCPDPYGFDADFGQAPMLVSSRDNKQDLVVGISPYVLKTSHDELRNFVSKLFSGAYKPR